MGTLAEATALAVTDGGFTVQLDPAWSGWGPAGGYLAAVALRAAGQVVPAGHRPVTLSCQFLATAQNAEADVGVEIVKPGGSACANVVLTQGGRRFFQAQVWTTSRTRGPDEVTARIADVPGPDVLAPIETHLVNSKSERVAFWSNMECRPVEFREPGGRAPLSRRLQRWYKFKGQSESGDMFLSAGCAALLIDANVWATNWRTCETVPDYAAPSLDPTVWFHESALISDWLLVDAVQEVARNVLVHGTVQVWNEGKRLIASGGSQCLVIPLPARG
jgi:acyl-CoA thioesterase